VSSDPLNYSNSVSILCLGQYDLNAELPMAHPKSVACRIRSSVVVAMMLSPSGVFAYSLITRSVDSHGHAAHEPSLYGTEHLLAHRREGIHAASGCCVTEPLRHSQRSQPIDCLKRENVHAVIRHEHRGEYVAEDGDTALRLQVLSSDINCVKPSGVIAAPKCERKKLSYFGPALSSD
jgi:hypothetical protein